VTVDALGLWWDKEGMEAWADYYLPFIPTTHTVKLWDSSGSILAQTIVSTAGMPKTQPSQWLFSSIAPIVLKPGAYVVAAEYCAGSECYINEFGAQGYEIPVRGPLFNSGGATVTTKGGIEFVTPRVVLPG